MKRLLAVALMVGVGMYAVGCSKKQNEANPMQEPMPIESLGTVNVTPAAVSTPAPVTTPAVQEVNIKTEAAPASAVTPAENPTQAAEGLPPQGPYKPTAVEIQTALKNAGLYTGAIDGKIGPMTKKAIEEFQKNNNIKVDGKVGPKTWEALKKYLNSAPKKKEKALIGCRYLSINNLLRDSLEKEGLVVYTYYCR